MTAATHNPPGGTVSGLERRLALRRRQDIVAVPQIFSGQKLWAVKDPVTLRYFHLRDEEFWVWQALDGVSSLAAIQEKFEKYFAPRRLTFMQLQSFLGVLHQEGLILADAPGQTRELLTRGRKLKRTKVLGALSNILALRFRGVDPQRFLDWLLDSWGWLISGWSLAVCLAIVFAAVSLVVTKFDLLLSRLPEFDSFLTPSTVIWLSVALAVTKVLHELGHALTCRYFGAECHELGFMFLVFTPCLYVNVSDSWMIVSKWRRAAIGAAGVGVELVLAGVATLLWWFSEPGLFNTLCFNIMLVGSISTLFFNGNPLLRYDGYYILADLAEVPNLSQAATSVVRESLAEWLLGIPMPRDDEYSRGKRLFLAIYAVLSFLYRTLVTVSILWLVHRLLKPHQLEAAAFLLACLVLGGMLAFPLWRSVQFVQYAYWSRQMKTRRATVSVLLIALAVVGISLAPLPHRVSAPVVLEAEDARRVYAPVAGILLDGAGVGSPIQAGQPVALLDNLDLKLEIARLRGLRDEQKLRLQNLRHRQTHDTKAAAEIPTAEEALADLEERLARRLEDERRLVIMAPVAGTVLPGRRKPRNYADHELETWSGLPLEESNRGCFIETGTLLCQIGDPTKFEASLVIDQGDMEFIRAGQDVQIQLDQHPGRLLAGTIREIAEIDLKITPTELLPAGMFPTRLDESGVYRPVGTVYQARVALEPAEMPLVIGEAGRAKVHAAPLSLARRLSRYLSHTFRFEL